MHVMPKKQSLLLVAMLATLLAACGGGSASGGAVTPTTKPTIGSVTATITGLGPLSNGPFFTYGIAADDSAVWVHNGDNGAILRIDPQSNAVVASLTIPAGPGGVAIGEGTVWVANATVGTLSRINPQTNAVVATVTLPSQNKHDGAVVAISPGAVWVNDTVNDKVVRVDPQTNRVVATIADQFGPTDISYGAGQTWVSTFTDSSHGLTRIDPATNQVMARIDVGSSASLQCTSVVALPQAVWAVALQPGNGSSAVLNRIDPATNQVVATIPTPDIVPFHFAADDHAVWIWGPDGLYRVDAQTNHLIGMRALSGGAGVALGAGSLWFADGDNGTLLRITPTA
jgi:streptogramin lyase